MGPSVCIFFNSIRFCQKEKYFTNKTHKKALKSHMVLAPPCPNDNCNQGAIVTHFQADPIYPCCNTSIIHPSTDDVGWGGREATSRLARLLA